MQSALLMVELMAGMMDLLMAERLVEPKVVAKDQ